MKKETLKDFQAGKRDCRLGIYDKWYRYNHNDGRSYDLGWTAQNLTVQNETVRFINIDI